MLGIGLALTSFGTKGGISDAADGGVLSGAAALLDGYDDGFAVDFRNLTMVVKDTTTPANNFNGDPNDGLTYPSPPTLMLRDKTGAWVSGTAMRPHHDAAGNPLGFPIQEERTNVFLNSRSPATQSIAVTAQAYTLSFYGTGTITLSGASTAGPLVGTGASDRVYLTFTPSAGTLTLTVSGTMDHVQLEAGEFASTPIVTAGSSATRTAAFPRIPLTDLPWNGDQGTIVARFRRFGGHTTGNMSFFSVGGYAAPDSINMFAAGIYFIGSATPDSYPDIVIGPSSAMTYLTVAFSYNFSGGSSALFIDDIQVGTDTNTFGTVAAGSSALQFGVRDNSGTVPLNAMMESLVYIPERLTGAQIAALGRPAPTGYDVFVVAGQSNTMSGAGLDRDLDAPSDQIDQWLQGSYAARAVEPLDHVSKPSSSIGFAQKFAKDYIAAGKLAAGRKILLVPCAQSGTGFVTGHWTPAGVRYTDMLSRTNAAVAGLPDAVVKGLLWHHGESDVGSSGTYAASLDTMIAGFRSGVTGASNAKFVCGGLADAFVAANGTGATTVQAALSGVGGRVSGAAFASAAGLATSDGTHFTAAAQRTLGASYFTAYDTVD